MIGWRIEEDLFIHIFIYLFIYNYSGQQTTWNSDLYKELERVSWDEIWHLSLLYLTSFNGNTSKSQLYFFQNFGKIALILQQQKKTQERNSIVPSAYTGLATCRATGYIPV